MGFYAVMPRSNSRSSPGFVIHLQFTFAQSMLKLVGELGCHVYRHDAPATIARCITIDDVAPGRRIAGLAAQLYSLRGGTSPGYGDLAALGEIASLAAAQNIEAMAVSPLHTLLPGTTSFAPYSPSSRCFIDSIHAALAGDIRGLVGRTLHRAFGVDGDDAAPFLFDHRRHEHVKAVAGIKDALARDGSACSIGNCDFIVARL